MRGLVAVVLVSACVFRSGATGDDAPGGSDGGSGGGPDAPITAATCLGSGTPFGICAMTTPSSTMALPATIYTSSGSANGKTFTVDANCLGNAYWKWQGSGQPDACVMFADAITLGSGSATNVYGARPLVLLATASITIAANQVLDVASHQGAALPGPGADSGVCAAYGASPASAGGGGAGGTFTAGTGGNGGSGANGATTGGNAALSALAPVPNTLSAGCTGQAVPGLITVPGGAGGGALYVASLDTITIAGTINASGAGGTAGAGTGGGGGGTGGMIVIDAPKISATGIVVANGGGGASGGSWILVGTTPLPVFGSRGSDPAPDMPGSAALGGSATFEASGGAGFAMGHNATVGASTSNAVGGGGGGGGGGGLIVARMNALMGAMVSPPAVPDGL
jgi:hypothetical protein